MLWMRNPQFMNADDLNADDLRSDHTKSKKDSQKTVFFREGISFLWGIAKNYIMYWGVTSSILAYPMSVYNTKDSQILQFYICVFVHYA